VKFVFSGMTAHACKCGQFALKSILFFILQNIGATLVPEFLLCASWRVIFKRFKHAMSPDTWPNSKSDHSIPMAADVWHYSPCRTVVFNRFCTATNYSSN